MLAVDKAIKENIHILSEHKVLLALSGGIDSMVLAHALIKSGISFSAAHVNYRLRGNQSDEDEVFVQQFCRKNNIRVFLKTHSLNQETQSNIQEAAREIRHSYFKELMKDYDLSLLLTAHHMNDSVENLFLNLSRGSGIKGLSSMSMNKNYILRPLIKISKHAIQLYAEIHQIKWREDSSNSKDYYLRNFIRLNIIPAIEKTIPHFSENTFRSISLLQKAQSLIEYYEKIWKNNNIIEDSNQINITLTTTAENYFVQSYLASKGFHPNTVEEIFKNLNSPGRQFESHDKWQAYLDRNKIILNLKEHSHGNHEYTIGNETSVIKMEKYFFTFTTNTQSEIGNSYLKNPRNKITIDKDKLTLPLVIREWHAGDSIKPLGMNSLSKKVQDILTDRKVSLPDKSNTLVILSGNEIIWLVNHCLSETVKISYATKNYYTIEFNPID